MPQFDDLPPVGVTADADPESPSTIPMSNPYHRFQWSAGFSVLSAPSKHSSDLMLEFDPLSLGNPSAPDAAQVGVGLWSATSCFRFDFHRMSVGCMSNGQNCVFNVTGVNTDIDTGISSAATSQTFTVPGCPSYQACTLTRITADESSGLTNLTSILIDVKADGQPKKWWADDMQLAWTDAGCDAAVCRSKVRDSVAKRARWAVPGKPAGITSRLTRFVDAFY